MLTVGISNSVGLFLFSPKISTTLLNLKTLHAGSSSVAQRQVGLTLLAINSFCLTVARISAIMNE